MLTRKSGLIAKRKTLIIAPMILVCILCFTENAFSDEKRIRKGNTVTYRGNVFEMSVPVYDTTIVIDPQTNKEHFVISSKDPRPLKMNEEKVYSGYEIDELKKTTTLKLGSRATEKPNLNSMGLKEYLLAGIKEEIKSLKDDVYYISLSNIVLDKSGSIVYFEYGGIKPQQKDSDGNTDNKIPESTQNAIANKITTLLTQAPKHSPAYINGKETPCLIDNIEFYNPFTTRNGKLESL